MPSVLNSTVALLTAGFGLIGWLAPRWTMARLGLATVPGNLVGLSEIRAVNGALYVGLGTGAWLLDVPEVWVLLGAGHAAAALGRATSLVADASGSRLSRGFLAGEIAMAATLLAGNLPAL